MKRGYLLPEGCKDLIDVLKLKPRPEPERRSPQLPVSPPPIVGEVVIPEQASASELAALVGQKPFQIIADLIELGVLATGKQPLGFAMALRVARKYGYIATRAA